MREDEQVPSFEDELNKAVDARTAAAASGRDIADLVRHRNATARVEAAARLNRLGGHVRNFLVKHGVPPVQLVAGVESTFRRPRLVNLCSGWFLLSTFLTTDGQLVRVASGKRMFAADMLKTKVKRGQHYLGRFDDIATATVPHDRGVASATFADRRRFTPHCTVAEFNAFYYGDLYEPLVDFPLIHAALLLPDDDAELYIVFLNDDDRRYAITAVHEQLRTSALKLVEER